MVGKDPLLHLKQPEEVVAALHAEEETEPLLFQEPAVLKDGMNLPVSHSDRASVSKRPRRTSSPALFWRPLSCAFDFPWKLRRSPYLHKEKVSEFAKDQRSEI